jgi:hypothetical protein
LAGLLLMPGMSMMSGAVKKKEQKFNAKSAGTTPGPCFIAQLCMLRVVQYMVANLMNSVYYRCHCYYAYHVPHWSLDANTVLFDLRSRESSWVAPSCLLADTDKRWARGLSLTLTFSYNYLISLRSAVHLALSRSLSPSRRLASAATTTSPTQQTMSFSRRMSSH